MARGLPHKHLTAKHNSTLLKHLMAVALPHTYLSAKATRHDNINILLNHLMAVALLSNNHTLGIRVATLLSNDHTMRIRVATLPKFLTARCPAQMALVARGDLVQH